MEYLDALPKSDLVLLLELIHEVKAAQNKKQSEYCLSKFKQLMLYDGFYGIHV